MVENQTKRCRVYYLDNAIFQPSKIKLDLVAHRKFRFGTSVIIIQGRYRWYSIRLVLVYLQLVIRPGPWIHLRTVIHGHHKIAQENKTQ